jgi:hypothetical protein
MAHIQRMFKSDDLLEVRLYGNARKCFHETKLEQAKRWAESRTILLRR